MTDSPPAQPQAAPELRIRTATIRICQPCLDLEGQECHTPECVFCFRSVTEAKWLMDKMMIAPIIDGERFVLVDEDADLPRATETGLTVEAALAELREMFPGESVRIEIHTGYVKIVVGWRGTSHPSLDECMEIARHRWAKSAARKEKVMPRGKPKYPSNTDLVKAADFAARLANTERNANPLYVKALIEVVEILEAAAAMGKLTEIRAWAKSRAAREGERT